MVRLQQFTKYPWAAERAKLEKDKKVAGDVAIDNKLEKQDKLIKEAKEKEKELEAELGKRSFTSK